jgi:cytochrome c oxidase subunit 2
MPPQSVLDPAGVQAEIIGWLWNLMLVVTAIVWTVVMGFLAVALRRATSRGAPHPAPARRLAHAIGAATTLTLAVLLGLLVSTVMAGRDIQSLDVTDAVQITVVGNQWWWDVEYRDSVPARHVRLANEIHLPRGRPVVFTLQSNDVIHSFWVPNLHGKVDLIPGRSTTLRLRADVTGRFRGQCAEYCGLQHAHMALDVIVDEPTAFDAWLDQQRAPAVAATSPAAARGQALLENGSCALCHTVRGTRAGGRMAPDLTHFGSRETLAAGTLPNAPDTILAWLRDPQAIKPGNRMPLPPLSEAQRLDLAAYLETLQ